MRSIITSSAAAPCPELNGSADDAFCRRLNDAWQTKLANGRLYSNELFLTLVSRPLQGSAGFVERLFRSSRSQDTLVRELRELHATRESFTATLGPYGARALTTYDHNGLTYSEPCAFLYGILNGDMRPVLKPEGDIGEALPDRRLSFGLDALEIEAGGGAPKCYGAIVSVKDYPVRSVPGMLDNVLRLPFEMVLSESFSFVDRQTTLNRMNLALRRLQAADDSAFSLRDELAAARDSVGSGRTAYGEHHLSVLVKSDDLADLDLAVADVQSALAEIGAIAVREDVNMEPAFWAQLPGNFKYIARKALISNANFASLASFHNHAAGKAFGQSLGRCGDAARDDRARALLFQLPQRRSRQFHRDRSERFGKNRAADVPHRASAALPSEGDLFRQGSRRGDIRARHRRTVRRAASGRAHGLQSAADGRQPGQSRVPRRMAVAAASRLRAKRFPPTTA